MIQMIKQFLQNIMNPERDFRERMFLFLNFAAEIAIFLVFLGDVFVKENPIEVAVLGLTLILAPIGTGLSVHYKKTELGGSLISLGIIFVILPVTFFFGGGLKGGSIIWFSFSFLLIGLFLTGWRRNLMLSFLTIVLTAEYIISYFFAGLVSGHSRSVWFVDSAISAVIVGGVICVMVWFQKWLYIGENERAHAQAKEIEQLSKAQNSFFASMSHEIRTPINTVLGLNEMILREDISDEVREDAENIRSAGGLLLTLINDILDMSKLESGQMRITPAAYQTREMLSEIVSMFSPRLQEKDLSFHVDITEELPISLEGDEVRIRQILINILNNAVKYTKEGSVTLTVEREDGEQDSANIIYTITDTGMGIRKESIPFLFTAFKRVDEEENRYIEGTGLGLSIVKQLVDLMGGSINVNSVYTKGSTFTVVIPQRVADARLIGQFAPDKSYFGRAMADERRKFRAPGAKVLVVDDNATNLMVAKKLLRDTDIFVDTAESGAIALEKTLMQTYHVILMDHLMPEMNGIECAQQIRFQKGGLCRQSKIVALTADASSEVRKLFEQEDFDGFLTKPVSGAELENTVHQLLPHDLIVESQQGTTVVDDTVQWINAHKRKVRVMITTESVADLPEHFIREYGISTIPHWIFTSEGRFKDRLELDAKGLLTYAAKSTGPIKTSSPSIADYENFFAACLEDAQYVIHIAASEFIARSGCSTAVEGAASFDNVYVVDSRQISSGLGFLALAACRMQQNGMGPVEIVEQLNEMKEGLRTSFIVTDPFYLVRSGQISAQVAGFSKTLMTSPIIQIDRGTMHVNRMVFGSKERMRQRYLDTELKLMKHADPRILFVIYSGLSEKELAGIREFIEKNTRFDSVYYVQTSAAVAANCGPGAFGFTYFQSER